jgi:hypothetical protein
VLQPPNYLVGSDGSAVPAPRYYRKMQRKLRRAQRHLSRGQKRSHNRSQAKLRVARVHERVANLGKEFVNQLSHKLLQRWDVLCVEDLNLKSLAKTKHAKSWFDASFGELFRQIEYKCLWKSKHFVQVDRFFASSKLSTRSLDIPRLRHAAHGSTQSSRLCSQRFLYALGRVRLRPFSERTFGCPETGEKWFRLNLPRTSWRQRIPLPSFALPTGMPGNDGARDLYRISKKSPICSQEQS